MARQIIAACLLAAAAATLSAVAQMPTEAPGKLDAKRVKAGTYAVDSAHTQIAFSLDHMGFGLYHGIFGDIRGSLVLDPAKPAASKVSIEIPMDKVVTTSSQLDQHLKSADFFDVAKHPTAKFESTSVSASGNNATINGNLTIKDITKPVVLKARFFGAGANPMNSAATVGFVATTSISRSAFGINFGGPILGDTIDLNITAAFEKKA